MWVRYCRNANFDIPSYSSSRAEVLKSLRTRSRLAMVQQDKGNLAEAEDLYLQLREHRQMRLGDEHPDVLDVQDHLGVI